MARKNLFVILSILLAVAAPLLMAIKSHTAQKAYPVVKVEIEPYDPRDLLYGHYMIFQYKWNLDEQESVKNCKGGHCCLCLGEGGQDPKATVMACMPEKPAQCGHMLRGAYYGGTRFDIGLNRYYVDEKIALPLENLFRNKAATFHVGLAIAPSGKAILEKLYVGGQPVNEYVTKHYDALTKPAPSGDTH